MLEKWKQSKFYLGWRKLKADLAPMTFGKKVEHIWMYYKEYMFVGFLVLMLLVAVVTSTVKANQKVLASGIMTNIYIDQAGFDYLSVDYFDHLGGKKGAERVVLDYISFGDLEDAEQGSDNISKIEALVARVSGKLLDYMILDKYAMETYIIYEVYMDLREFFTEEELAALAAENRLIYAQQEGMEDRWPVAVDITDLPFVQDNVNSEGEVYFALSGSTPRPEICRDMWEYLHQWESKE